MRIIALSIMMLLMFSCNQTTTELNEPATTLGFLNVDSLNVVFLSGWNNHDSAAIMNTIAENGIVMNDSLMHKGRNSIANNWVSGGTKVLSNIKTFSAIRGSNETMAYDAGTYTLDLTPPGGPLLKEAGNYTLVWEKQKDESIKLTLVHIEDVSRMPDIK